MIEIVQKKIGDGNPTFITGDIGINHNGNIELAEAIIASAAKYGLDAVKFQKRDLGSTYTAKELFTRRATGELNVDQKRTLEFSEKNYEEITQICKEKRIIWFASAWDVESVEFLERFEVPVYKIPSALAVDMRLLSRIIDTGKPVFISLGMCNISDVNMIWKFISEYSYGQKTALLQCTSNYPCDNKDINLRIIPVLRKYSEVVGYSGHERGVAPSVWAVIMGAHIIERHITIDRTLPGSDQAASLEQKGIEMLVRDIREIPSALGDGNKKILDCEMKHLLKLSGTTIRKLERYRYYPDDPDTKGRGAGRYMYSKKEEKFKKKK